jgi:phosphatidylglycerol:prolipoprotein diacylglycerol transferase
MMPYKVFEPFHMGPFMINFYGIMFAVGTFIAFQLAVREARMRQVDSQIMERLFFCLILSGIIGARAGYILLYWPQGQPMDFFDIFKIWEGGLSFYGGFIGAAITGVIFLKLYKMNFWDYADAVTIPLVVGHFFGRIGGYLTGGHPGTETDLPWAIMLNGELRHPVVLYEMIGLVILYLLKSRLKLRGILFTTYISLYAVQRLILDIFRIELTDPRYFGLTPSQFIAIGLLSLSVLLMLLRFYQGKVLSSISMT